jgi:general secretion pathway protein J
MKPGRSRQRPPVPQRGFTLVEVMVALTILSLVMLATVTGLRTLANTQKAITRLTERVDEVRTVSSFLRDTLETSVAGSGGGGLTLGGGGQDSTFFEVTPDAVQWKSVVLFGESYGGSYLLRVGREGEQLMLRWLEPSAQGRALDWAAAQSRVLVEGLEELEISYRRELGTPWKNQWDREGVPSLLRLQIKASGRYWPELILAMRQ